MSERLDRALHRFMRLDALMLKAKRVADACRCESWGPEPSDPLRCIDDHPTFEYDEDGDRIVQNSRLWLQPRGNTLRERNVAWWYNRSGNTRDQETATYAEYDCVPNLDEWCGECARQSRFRWWQKYWKRKRNGAMRTLRAAWDADRRAEEGK